MYDNEEHYTRIKSMRKMLFKQFSCLPSGSHLDSPVDLKPADPEIPKFPLHDPSGTTSLPRSPSFHSHFSLQKPLSKSSIGVFQATMVFSKKSGTSSPNNSHQILLDSSSVQIRGNYPSSNSRLLAPRNSGASLQRSHRRWHDPPN